MKKKKFLMCILSVFIIVGLVGCQSKDVLDAKNPVTIEVWNYYNGEQLVAFDALVEEFNATVGTEKGIIVKSYSQGSVNDLETNVLAAIKGEVGAENIPNIFAAYADTAYTVNMLEEVVDLSKYLTKEEMDSYVKGYMEEGDFSGDGEIKIFPFAKSTEVMVINKTDWDIFAEEAGVTYENLENLESLVETAQIYYEWSDAKTPDVPGDGKALFGRDAMANYILIGSMQLGTEIFTVKDGKMTLNFEENTIRKLWECYYVPYIKGYFASSGRFRSDDLKTGNIIAYVGASSGASFYPDMVSISDTENYPIEIDVIEAPQFKETAGYAVQQGAGMVVTKGSEGEIAASLEFLKWMTEDTRNISFAVQSGYLPVKNTANEKSAVVDSGIEMNDNMKETLSVAIDTVNENDMYTTKAFETGTEARAILEDAMSNRAIADRQVVVERIASGMSLDEAATEFCTDENFKEWFEETKTQLEAWEIK